MKLIVNKCFGNWCLSDKAINLFKEKTGKTIQKYDISYRNDPMLIEVVEELGEEVNEKFSRLVIKEFPDGYNYFVSNYDGQETIILSINEEYLRTLIREASEDEVINYVMGGEMRL